ncbi:MAG: arylesterase [Pyrinomonadaceae bacterium]|nr:arylesterase [Pyrinomonadaceae bacterium]MCX7640534.1 arylesterase [Pyrinomonadaceae bacterium]MDW8303885.1 arylesterase [Acidobacteriota bacterium]
MLRISVLLLSLLFALGCQNDFRQNIEEKTKPVKQPQRQNRPKIVAFGDSLTAGFGLSESESYPYLLQKKLDAEGYNYEVINAGISGDTTQGGLERIDWSLEDDSVEILILALGGNDLLRAVPPSKMKKNLAEIIKRAKSKGVKVLLCGMLAPPTMGQEYQREFNNVFPDLADEYKIAYMPFLLEGVALNKELNQADGIHPNAEGMKVMTENIYRHLKPLLEKR